jgi:hypothetical protein
MSGILNGFVEGARDAGDRRIWRRVTGDLEGVSWPGITDPRNQLDEINAVHARGAIPVSAFTRSMDSIICYDSVVAFERRPQGARQAPITIGM